MFAGIGPSRDVAAYLEGVSRDQIRDVDLNPDRVRYRRRWLATPCPTPPEEQTFWAAQATTSETTDLTWEVESGDWTVVVMNADASEGVDVDARLGIKVGWFLPAAIGLLAGRARPARWRHRAGDHRRPWPGRARAEPAP